mmetsp:Transcript_46520/g.56328  ORF Transcript_46520/g.56328 Transcript_46520/m.56328 type:complete len:84 (-) Transcript_46520:302-553(-)
MDMILISVDSMKEIHVEFKQMSCKMEIIVATSYAPTSGKGTTHQDELLTLQQMNLTLAIFNCLGNKINVQLQIIDDGQMKQLF